MDNGMNESESLPGGGQVLPNAAEPDTLKTRVLRYVYLLERFARRYGWTLLVLALAAIVGWTLANSVSNYTHGGWEIHFEQRFNERVLINIHFHHWYYGLPLYLIAFLLIDWNINVSTFLFGFGQALAAHSYINEGGIPSILEGGPVWRLGPEIYFPLVTALAMLYAFFLVRREEWLTRAREREELAITYLVPRAKRDQVMEKLNTWARRHFTKQRVSQDKEKETLYGEWRALDREARGEWQMHYVLTPFDTRDTVLVIRFEHIPLQGRLGLLDDWLQELDLMLDDDVEPVISHSDRAPAAPTPQPTPAEGPAQG